MYDGWMYACMPASMDDHVSMYVCLHVIHVCMYACMRACMDDHVCNVASPIVNPPLFFFFRGGGLFAIVNSKSGASPKVSEEVLTSPLFSDRL